MILSKGIGIDLGTTNSAVAVMDPTNSEVIVHTDRVGRSTTPSCVWRAPDSDDFVVGHHAYQRRGALPEPVRSVKRNMGSNVTSDLSGMEASPTKVSSIILKELRSQAAEEVAAFGDDGVRYTVDRAIITVPAYFELPAIEATRQAGQMAGLEVLELLNEPTAGAIHYCWKHDIEEGLFLVYDLGGGTFDVSLLQRIANEFSVLAISGNNFLGGDNFDIALGKLIAEKLAADGYAIDPDATGGPEQRLAFTQLLRLAEQVKIALSGEESYLLRDQSMADADGNRVIAEMVIERAEFEELIREDVEETIEHARDAISKAKEQAGITLGDIDHVILVGGSTHIPLVQSMVADALCSDENGAGAQCPEPSLDDPELAVAMGAAIRAASLGIAITDDEETACVSFRGLTATDGPVRTIAGRVKSIDDRCQVAGGSICLTAPGTDLFLETKLDEHGSFCFESVPVGESEMNEFTVTVTDANNQRVSTFEYKTGHGEAQRRLGSEDFGTAVLPMPLLLEGREGGQLTQRVLLPEGETLPAQATFTFYLSDASGMVRLPIYQGNRVIKEIIAEVPPTLSVGEPVLFQIECDRQARITVDGRVGGESFGGSIEAPSPEAPPTGDEIAATRSRFETLRIDLDSEQQEEFAEEFERLVEEVQQAEGAGDSAMAIQRMADVQGLLKRMELERPLRPPLEETLAIIDRCEELWEQVEGDVEGIDEPRFREFCDNTRSDLAEAYRGRAEQQYQERVEAAQVMARYLTALIEDDEGSDLSDEERAGRVLGELSERTAGLTLLAMLSSDPDAGRQMERAMETLSETRREWDAGEIEATEVLRRCQVVLNDTNRALERLRPDAEDDGTGGLVDFQTGSFDGSTGKNDLLGGGFKEGMGRRENNNLPFA